MVWSANLAYAIGLITTDGCLSKDGRHIILVSKDIDQLQNFAKVLNLNNKISPHTSSYGSVGNYYHIQFGNVKLYRFLLSIGLTPAKSKTLGKLKIPDKFFADFLRGSLDGDGCTYSYYDKRWKSSFMFYTTFTSASRIHLEWVSNQVYKLYGILGKIKYSGKNCYQLVFAKQNSLILLGKIYYRKDLVCLKRKWFKIQAALDIIAKQAGVL